jgi:hypothetical protein
MFFVEANGNLIVFPWDNSDTFNQHMLWDLSGDTKGDTTKVGKGFKWIQSVAVGIAII